MALHLGKLPTRKGAITFAFSRYFDISNLPAPPDSFGQYFRIPKDSWGELGNDRAGDCVWAAFAHQFMLWGIDDGAPITFTPENVLGDYSADTGYDPKVSGSDHGTDVADASSYLVHTGIVDSTGARRKVDAYVALAPRDLSQLKMACWLFRSAGLGFEFPESARGQFERGEPWTVVEGSPIVGGHYVLFVGVDASGNFLVITWGKLHPVSREFILAYMDEGQGYLDIQRTKKRFPMGFNHVELVADLHARGVDRT